ncbi:all-trans-retinol 13,14-reductase-like isoform X1 [Mytilus californianus]|uniref:all-trans-retinol 13,14-reductase-like isoform X1 n=1 Tax=Mytilus californianus TaxID=6549 RepID=UPI0022480CB5|nr:all-trans-retinol 13,14-reductase-like isoform X1 [Mytilus californianus]
MAIDIGMFNFVEYLVTNPSILIAIVLLYCFIFGLSILFSGPKPGKNPFSINHVRPVAKLVTDKSQRKKVLKQKFKPYDVPSEKLDAIVIGSGIGGLSTAVLLAKAGKKVLVLEQHGRAGGCCHTFTDKGYEFDTGIHYIGKMYDGHPDKVLTDQLTGGAIEYPLLEEIYDVVRLGDPAKSRAYNISSGREKLQKTLIEYFPKEETAIKKFMQFLKESRNSFTGYFAMKVLPKRVVKLLIATGIYKLMFRSYAKFHGKSLKSLLDELTENEELKAVLSYCWGDYGVVPSKSSQLLHAALFNHYAEGAYYIRGGSSEIPYQIVQRIEALGGKVLVKAPVQKILTDDQGRAVGVLVGKGTNSCELFAKNIISDAGVSNTFLRLLPKEVAVKSSIFPMIKKVGESFSFISMFVGLEGTTKELGLKAQNIWAFTRPDVEELTKEYVNLSVEEAAEAEVPLLFVSFPSAKDPSWSERFPGKSNLLIITICPYKWFDRWEDEKVKKRGGEYEGLKNAIGRQMLNQVLLMFPQLEDKVAYTDVGSPLSNKYYLGFDKGEMYGLDHTLQRFSPEVSVELRAQTDIPGLFLTGQDISTCGFTGAMFGGMFCAGAVLNRKLHNDLETLVTEIRKTNQTKKE